MDAAELCKTRKASWCKRVAQCACGAIHSFSTGSVENQESEYFNESESAACLHHGFTFARSLSRKTNLSPGQT